MEARRWRQLRGALPLSALLASLAAARWARSVLGPLDIFAGNQLPTLCPLRLLTGLSCPTCGLGRSLAASCSGDFVRGLHHHPAGPLLLLVALSLAVLYALRQEAARGAWRRATAAFAARPRLRAGLLAAYVAWGLLR